MSVEDLVRQGVDLGRRGQVEEAISFLDRAITLNPYYSPALWAKALLRLSLGDTFWPPYDWHLPPFTHPTIGWYKRDLTIPLWDGQPLNGRILLLHCDQGYGDFFQFVRFAHTIPGKVVVDFPEVLGDWEPGTEGDVHAPLMLLPKMLTIPTEPYLRAISTPLQEIVVGDVKVGICWQGSPKHGEDDNRSIPLPLWNDILDMPCVFYSLQQQKEGEKCVNIGKWCRTWTDTASVVDKLDLVITVDTAVAHLAAGMGKPTWIILPEVADWRWLRGRRDSPWYPTVRLFRRTTSWEEVLTRVRLSLLTDFIHDSPMKSSV